MPDCGKAVVRGQHNACFAALISWPVSFHLQKGVELELKNDRLSTHLNAAYDKIDTMRARITELEEGRRKLEIEGVTSTGLTPFSLNIFRHTVSEKSVTQS